MSETTEKAILAGGCFWGMQDLIGRRPGVLTTRVGYTGGDIPNATYWNHGSHAEAIEIVFDPAQISYRDLLEFFFQVHDPTTRNRQGNDLGLSYRSAIFYLNDEQKRVAYDTIASYAPPPDWREEIPRCNFWEEFRSCGYRNELVLPITHRPRVVGCILSVYGQWGPGATNMANLSDTPVATAAPAFPWRQESQ
jgi:peptide-methionine (S)-S-oxide reductase